MFITDSENLLAELIGAIKATRQQIWFTKYLTLTFCTVLS